MNCSRFCALLSIVVLWDVSARISHAAPAASAPAKVSTEVVVVATQHFLSDMPDGYTPGHLRALLDKIAPSIVVVEAAHNVPDPWQTAPYELAQVTRPWAIERNVQVIPAGWSDPTYQSRIGTMFADLNRAGKAEALNQVEGRFQKDLAERAMTCARMNDAWFLDRWRSYHAELHELCGKDTPWEQWNAQIAARVIDVCRDHGGRVAVVFGGAHAYFLTDRLSMEQDLRVIPAETFFPLSDEEVRTHTKDSDYVQAMRLLNFMPGALSGQQLADLQKKLDRLKPLGTYRNDFQYFSAKLLLHQGKASEALEALADLSNVPPDVLLAFDGTTPVRDGARLQTCVALDQQGDSVAVLQSLRAIANDAGVCPSIRQAARAMLEGIKAK